LCSAASQSTLALQTAVAAELQQNSEG